MGLLLVVFSPLVGEHDRFLPLKGRYSVKANAPIRPEKSRNVIHSLITLSRCLARFLTKVLSVVFPRRFRVSRVRPSIVLSTTDSSPLFGWFLNPSTFRTIPITLQKYFKSVLQRCSAQCNDSVISGCLTEGVTGPGFLGKSQKELKTRLFRYTFNR